MGNAVRLGDTGTDHDGFPPTPTTAGSGTVKIDGIPVCRLGDPLAPHDKPKHPPHGRSIAGGSATVFADGKPVARTGDSVSCGGVVIGGGTVNIG
ncbi:PAAR motif protein [Grimontia celer]|uniref:PAAR motif protein n=1 Tax=Grimontia celer TaxID=1796497 RepID=A0A128FGV8_9GAMM|nr:type VI secretion system PAAR protein [Grimontia celer]CZF85496.1 PAAR motif protein [Grimontia celer]